jgi:two-component system OmpR family sensor kinase
VSRFLSLSGQKDGTLATMIVAGQTVQAGRLDADGQTRALSATESRALEGMLPEQVPFTSEVGWLGHYRLIAEQLPGGGQMVVGLPLHQLNDTISRLEAIVALVALAGVVLAGPASAAVIGAALRPLHRLAGAASWVAEMPLDHGQVPLSARVTAAMAADADPRTEVGQVGVALNAMTEHVSAALESRQVGEANTRSFLADASHELRTPLSAIRRHTELAGRAGDDLPDGLIEVLGRIRAQTDRMSSLVDDMLLLARIDAGRPLARERVDLSQLLTDAIRDAHAAGPNHQWKLALPPREVEALGDAPRLTQVLSNLLTNARVHTPPGTAVQVELTDQTTELVLTVVDDGPGIPADLLPQVFGRFARGDTSRSRAAGSTGLGLAIAHAVVTAHAGTITAHSKPGHTAFTMRLPKAGGAAEHPGPDA